MHDLEDGVVAGTDMDPQTSWSMDLTRAWAILPLGNFRELRDCEAFASANDGTCPQRSCWRKARTIVMITSDSVRLIWHSADLEAVMIAQVMLYHWQTRRSLDWCKTTDGQFQSVGMSTVWMSISSSSSSMSTLKVVVVCLCWTIGFLEWGGLNLPRVIVYE